MHNNLPHLISDELILHFPYRKFIKDSRKLHIPPIITAFCVLAYLRNEADSLNDRNGLGYAQDWSMLRSADYSLSWEHFFVYKSYDIKKALINIPLALCMFWQNEKKKKISLWSHFFRHANELWSNRENCEELSRAKTNDCQQLSFHKTITTSGFCVSWLAE